MNSYYELPNLGSGIQQAQAERPSRRTGAVPGIGASWLIKGLQSALRRSVGGISRWRLRRSAVRELQALSDHHLRDIGLDRSQIVSTVEELIEAADRPA